MILSKKKQAAWIDKMPDSTEIHFDDNVNIIAVPNGLASFPVDDDGDDRVQDPIQKMLAYGRTTAKGINWLWIHKNFQPNA